jgi:beta-mannanase
LATGLTYNCIETYTDDDPTWADWANPWITSRTDAPFVAWVAADPTRHQLIDTQNLIPDQEGTNANWTADCATGDYNTYATQFATNMIAAGFGYSVIRLGAEMNGNWEIDSLGTTVAEWQQWGQCFAQEVTAMRAVPGAHFLFEWNVNEGYRDIPLADYYPGNAYVDLVGISLYDQSRYPLPPVGSPGRWHALVSEPMGLSEIYAFAAQHEKPLSIPEWGTVTTQGDDGNYVADVGAFVASHDVAYQAWLDSGAPTIYPLSRTEAPQSVASYVRAISRRVARPASR